jgi:hypothetical protein
MNISIDFFYFEDFTSYLFKKILLRSSTPIYTVSCEV